MNYYCHLPKITRYKFYLDQNDIEIVQSYCYLGIVFSSCGTFSRAVKALYDKASKALFAMKKIDTCDNALLTLKLFDTLVLPIMTYSIEVWGPYFFDECKLENLHSLKCMSESMSVEKINVKLCKYVLGVSRKSSNDAVRGELGRYPILLMTMHHWIKFVSRSYTLPVDNILKLSLPTLPEFLDKPIGLTWASKVQSLISTSISKLGSNLSVETLYNPALPSHIQGDFASMYRQSWINSINKNFDISKQNKLRTYALFKSSFAIENYVLNQRKAKRRQFTKLRISSHHLDVETGRYTRPITPRHLRICKNCNLEEIGDEFHFLLKCPKFQQQRQELFYELSEICEIRNNLDHNTMIKIMHYGHGDIEVASLVCEFVDSCLPNAWNHLCPNHHFFYFYDVYYYVLYFTFNLLYCLTDLAMLRSTFSCLFFYVQLGAVVALTFLDVSQTPHGSPSWVSYGASVVDCVVSAPHCPGMWQLRWGFLWPDDGSEIQSLHCFCHIVIIEIVV